MAYRGVGGIVVCLIVEMHATCNLNAFIHLCTFHVERDV